MACRIILVNPINESVIKQKITDSNYKDSLVICENLNNKLNEKSNPKNLFWTIRDINI